MDPHIEYYKDEEGKTRTRRVDKKEVCDFCLAPGPTWEYPAAEMEVVSTIINRSDDPWGACDACHDLIEAHNIDGLVERCVEEQPKHEPPDPVISYSDTTAMRRVMRQNVLRFMDARTGPAIPYQREEPNA